MQEGCHLVMPGEDELEWCSNMNAKVKKGTCSSKKKQQQVKSLYAPTTVPKAPDNRGVVNVSSKWQVEHLPVDDNDDESLEDNDNSDEDGSGPHSDEEEDVVDMPPSKACACIMSTKHEFNGGTSNASTQWALIGKLDTYRVKGALQPTKHLWVIHNRYHQQIHQHIGLCVDPRVNVRPPKVPEPRAYGSEIGRASCRERVSVKV